MPDATTSASSLAKLDRLLPRLYLAVALLVTSLVCVLSAPFFAPDEPDQSARAMELSHGRILAHFGVDEDGNQQAGDDIDTSAIAAMAGMDSIRMTWEKRNPDFHHRSFGAVDEASQQQLAGLHWQHSRAFLPFQNTAVYPPGLYLPAIFGWRIAEAANLTIFHSLQLARLFSAFTAVGLGWLALRLCACSRFTLLPFLLLPSTLFLNAGCTQDAVLLSAAALIAALLTRPLVAQREFTSAEFAVMTILIALCGTARPPYVALVLLLFIPGTELRRKPLRAWLPPFAAAVCSLAIAGLWRHLVLPLGIEWADEANPDLQKLFLRTHPFTAACILIRATGSAAVDLVHRGLYVIGWNDLVAPTPLLIASAIMIAALLLTAPPCPLRTRRARLLLAAAIAAPLFGITLAEYIIWTPPGLHDVYGIQPRYWLPILPVLAILLQGRLPVPRLGKARTALLLSATAAIALMAATLPWMVAHAFYRESIGHVLRLNLQ